MRVALPGNQFVSCDVGVEPPADAALHSRLADLARTKQALERQLTRCCQQLDHVMTIGERLPKAGDPDDLEQILLQDFGAMLRTRGVFLDRGGCMRQIALDADGTRQAVIDARHVRAVLGPTVDAVRVAGRALVVCGLKPLGGAAALLGVLSGGGDETGVAVALRSANDPPFDTGDLLAAESLLLYGTQLLHAAATRRHLQRVTLETVYALVNAIDAKDNYTSDHSERVGRLARRLGEALALPKAQLLVLEWAGLLHDVGKIGISERILNKPGPLTEAEFREVRNHPRIGHDMLCPVAQFAPVLNAVLYHHENYDGSGYPEGRRGDDIPLEARIIHVADIFDALTTRRPYRAGCNGHQALRQLESDAGRVTDPYLTRLLAQIVAEDAGAGMSDTTTGPRARDTMPATAGNRLETSSCVVGPA